MILIDPLNLEDLKVTDYSTAAYALELANDIYYSIHFAKLEVQKKLERAANEVYRQSLRLVQRYVFVTNSQGVTSPIGYVPDPIPPAVPRHVRDGIFYMRAQLEIEKQRAQTELAEDLVDNEEALEFLQNQVKEWFLGQVNSGAGWINGLNQILISGCTLTYGGNDLSFSYKELDYE